MTCTINEAMETSRLNREETTIIFTDKNDNVMTVSKPQAESQSCKAKINTEAFLPRDLDDDYRYDEELKSPFMVKKFHFSNPTFASEHKEKACLNNRLPDFTLTHKTLVSNTKFLEKSILPDKTPTRNRKARKIVYSEDGKHIKRLPDIIPPVRRSRSMINPPRKTNSFAGFKLTQSEAHRIKKISYETPSKQNSEQKTQSEMKGKTYLNSKCWPEDTSQTKVDNQHSLMEIDDQELCDDVFNKGRKLPKRRVRKVTGNV